MCVRHCDNRTLDKSFDREVMGSKSSPRKHNPSIPLKEEEYVIMKDGPKAKSWSVVQVYQTPPDRTYREIPRYPANFHTEKYRVIHLPKNVVSKRWKRQSNHNPAYYSRQD